MEQLQVPNIRYHSKPKNSKARAQVKSCSLKGAVKKLLGQHNVKTKAHNKFPENFSEINCREFIFKAQNEEHWRATKDTKIYSHEIIFSTK